jgi:hypothetical protein
MSSNEPLTREELTVWMTGNTMPITRHENMERVLAMLDENSRLHTTLASVQAEYARAVEELRDVKADRVILEARWEKAQAERDEARDAATWEGKEALTAALEAVERQGEASHARALAAEARAEELAKALRLQMKTHDQGHSPCACPESKAALTADDAGVTAWLEHERERVRAEEREKLKDEQEAHDESLSMLTAVSKTWSSTAEVRAAQEHAVREFAAGAEDGLLERFASHKSRGDRIGKALAEHDARVRAEALEEAAALIEHNPGVKMNDSTDLNTRQRARWSDRIRALASTPAKEKPPAAPPCGGSRCHQTDYGTWIHSSKSYGTCDVRAATAPPCPDCGRPLRDIGKGGGFYCDDSDCSAGGKTVTAPPCVTCEGVGVVLRGPRQRDDDLDEWGPCPSCRGSTRGGGRK